MAFNVLLLTSAAVSAIRVDLNLVHEVMGHLFTIIEVTPVSKEPRPISKSNGTCLYCQYVPHPSSRDRHARPLHTFIRWLRTTIRHRQQTYSPIRYMSSKRKGEGLSPLRKSRWSKWPKDTNGRPVATHARRLKPHMIPLERTWWTHKTGA